MLRKTAAIILACAALVACASEQPRIVQTSANSPEVRLTSGMATQVELPDSERVRSVAVGNPSLVSAEQADNIVNLMPKGGSGETNLIVRAVDKDGDAKVYQYRVIVEGP